MLQVMGKKNANLLPNGVRTLSPYERFQRQKETFMALYWPEQKVALDIVDDPYRNPFNGDESYTVLKVTCAELCDFDSYCKVMERLCELLGKDMPDMPGWEDKSRALHALLLQETMEEMAEDSCDLFSDTLDDAELGSLSNVEILATSQEEGERMRAAAREKGQYVRGMSIWDGPVPRGSFEILSNTTRMSTPEYFFFRKANQLPLAKAVALGIELCGKYRTSLTQYDRGEGYDFLKNSRTNKDTIRNYLRDVKGTKEGKRARRILRLLRDECSTPMACHLYLLLCLAEQHGSYGFSRAHFSVVFDAEHGFMPSSSGKYLAYDLCWPSKHVALQYTGTKPPSSRDLKALQTNGMHVLYVTDSDVADPQKFDEMSRKLAKLLGEEVPEPTAAWREARDKLRKTMPVPDYDHMRLTMDDISEHCTA